jgi:hypothetical protein
LIKKILTGTAIVFVVFLAVGWDYYLPMKKKYCYEVENDGITITVVVYEDDTTYEVGQSVNINIGRYDSIVGTVQSKTLCGKLTF